MNQEKLKAVLENHFHWINEDCDGWETMRADLKEAYLMRADLEGVCLIKADLRGADLSVANLMGTGLSEADLSEAVLTKAYLMGADLARANLTDVDLIEANLIEANLRGADLRGAILDGAYLTGADLKEAKISIEELNKVLPICCPEEGEFIGWKKSDGRIVKLKITEDAKRSSATTRKCRCSKAIVLAIENIDGSPSGLSEVRSHYDRTFVYKVGETVEVPNFDMDRKNECAPGIHFFITRQEAVDYVS